ncbi:MAG: polysulfide reductase NrfD [Cyclobacteriaceae bacterium]|nr:polysulfide reductase NrfD [Cyclobacteriaceae bacterium]
MKDNNISSNEAFNQKVETDLLAHLIADKKKFNFFLSILIAIILVGIFAYYRQVRYGLIVTSMRDYTSWGIYISNFVFLVAISLVGSLFSAILKLAKVPWSTPLTRISEIIAIGAIICASVIIIVDMGRPDRFIYVVIHGRIQSPIIWDVIIISTYLTISLLLLYISLIPDLAICRDKLTDVVGWKKWFYRVFSINWKGTPEQYKLLHKISYILAVIVIPVAFAIHTVTSWLFSTTWRPGWDSTNLGPYFVSGALMAGAAIIIVAMYFIRNTLNLKEYLTDKLFDHMGKLLVLLSLVYLYFNINEYLGPAFKMVGVEGEHIIELFFGAYAPMYWIVQIFGLILPIVILIFAWGRKPLPMLIISILVLLGAWFKRFLIVIPSLQHPYLPIQDVQDSYRHYIPSWEEWAITFASFAGCLLIITFLIRLLPVIPIWEIQKENEEKLQES